MEDILDEESETVALKMLKELKKDVEKIMKTRCEPNGIIKKQNKEIENLNLKKERNPRAKKHND